MFERVCIKHSKLRRYTAAETALPKSNMHGLGLIGMEVQSESMTRLVFHDVST